jgi:hypothetical protein
MPLAAAARVWESSDDCIHPDNRLGAAVGIARTRLASRVDLHAGRPVAVTLCGLTCAGHDRLTGIGSGSGGPDLTSVLGCGCRRIR